MNFEVTSPHDLIRFSHHPILITLTISRGNTKAHQWTWSWASSIHLTSSNNYFNFNIIIPSHSWSPSSCYPRGSLTKIMYAFLFFPTCTPSWPLGFTTLTMQGGIWNRNRKVSCAEKWRWWCWTMLGYVYESRSSSVWCTPPPPTPSLCILYVCRYVQWDGSSATQ